MAVPPKRKAILPKLLRPFEAHTLIFSVRFRHMCQHFRHISTNGKKQTFNKFPSEVKKKETTVFGMWLQLIKSCHFRSVTSSLAQPSKRNQTR
jgi:hypothetical protein